MRDLHVEGVSALVTGIALLLAMPAAAAELSGGRMTLGSDLFEAGTRVRLAEQVFGDAFLAGRQVEVSGGVGGDLLAAGTELQIGGRVGHNLFAAGRSVELDGSVIGNARLAAAELHIMPAARIAGGLSLAGARIEFEGQSQSYLTAAGRTVVLDGHVGGDAHIAASELTVGPQAVIDGSLTFRGPRPPSVAASARVRDGVHFIQQREGRAARARGLWVSGGWLWLLGWMIAGGVILALWPQFSREVTSQTARHAAYAGLIGLLVVVLTPIVMVLLLVTVIGIPLALLLLALYLLVLPIGYLAAAATIAERIAARAAITHETVVRRALTLAATLLVLFVVRRIPYLGPIIAFLLLIGGVGGILLAAQRARGSPVMSAAVPPPR